MRSKIENFALGLADFVIRRRFLVIALTLLSVLACASGLPKLQFANNYRVFFSSSNPDFKAFEAFQNTYTKTDNIMFVIKPSEGKIFTPVVMKAVEEITEAAWKLPYATRVDSVTNFQYSEAEGDNLNVDDFIRDAGVLSREGYAKKEQQALRDPSIYRNLISEDVETTAVNVIFQYPEKKLTELPEAVGKAKEIVAQMQEKYPDLKIVLSGISMLNMASMEAGNADMQTLTPIMYLVLIVIMVLCVRSISGVIATMVVILFSMFAAMGLGGYGGVSLTPISVMAPTIIMTLAIADSIHILMTMITGMREGQDKITAIKESMRINFVAVTITSLTTVVGFLTLNMLDTPPFWHLGNITAAGIVLAWLYSLTFLPAIVSLLPVKVKPRKDGHGVTSLLSRYADFIISNHKSVLMLSSVAAIVLISMVPRIEINDQWIKYFDYRIPFRADAEFAMKELGGTYLIEYSVKAGESGGVNDPAYLKNLAKFSDWLRTQPEVMHVFSLSDIMKRLNKNMHGDNQNWYRLPDDRELSAQYLLLYELSLPYGLDLNDRVNIDKSSSRLTVSLGDQTTRKMKEFIDRTDRWVAENFPQNMSAKPTGPIVMFTYITHRNTEGMLQGNVVAVVVISLIMILALRSFRIGMLSIVPNAVPILMTFGLWALTFEKIGMASSTVSAVALGIVVDDSVHFLSKYLRARREKGMSRPEAIKYAYETVGLALIATTVILVLGFAVMATSLFEFNKQLGLMTAATMVIALIMDFTLLPALLLIGHEKDAKTHKEKKNEFANQAA